MKQTWWIQIDYLRKDIWVIVSVLSVLMLAVLSVKLVLFGQDKFDWLKFWKHNLSE